MEFRRAPAARYRGHSSDRSTLALGRPRQMRSTSRWALVLAIASSIISPATATSPPSPAPLAVSTAVSPALGAYLEGLDALHDGRAADAVTAFSRALETRGDDPRFVLARGIAETLARQFPAALEDLDRAGRLGLRGREAELWTYAAEAMSGQVGPDHALGGGPRSLGGAAPALVSIPGHMAQGRDDYPTDYASYVIYDLAMPYQESRLPPDQGGAGDPNPHQRPAIAAAMRRAGAWFASREAKRADLAPAHLARARTLHDQKRYTEALDELDHARAAYPADPDVRFLIGDSWLALGRPATARRELTVALTSRTDFAAAYLARARAAATLGDAKRAEADLATAARLDRDAAGAAKGSVARELGTHRVDAEVTPLVAALDAAARAGSSEGDLVAAASRVVAADGARRLRYDEGYQDGLRVREDAVRADPRNADKKVEVARYLILESENRGEAVEPRRAVETYRWQLSREAELERAVRLADAALATEPDHARAMIWKAMALDGLDRGNEAESLAEKGLALSHDDADALQLAAHFRARRADRASSEAASLRQERCSSSTRNETRSDGEYEVTTTTCYPPSQADVARAEQLEALARELRQKARAAIVKAVAVTKGTPQALLKADLELWFGDPGQAVTILEQTVSADPRSLEAQEALADLYAKTGQREKAEEQLAVARQLVHTTAAPLLRPRLGAGRAHRVAGRGRRLRPRALDRSRRPARAALSSGRARSAGPARRRPRRVPHRRRARRGTDRRRRPARHAERLPAARSRGDEHAPHGAWPARGAPRERGQERRGPCAPPGELRGTRAASRASSSSTSCTAPCCPTPGPAPATRRSSRWWRPRWSPTRTAARRAPSTRWAGATTRPGSTSA
ncbi:MAG: tetratricopeptide repeat protein [Deltaproteobacteria bacterium]|nr:tetratricopeptide repeat protein [Deltaproteobacteria bacterium]